MTLRHSAQSIGKYKDVKSFGTIPYTRATIKLMHDFHYIHHKMTHEIQPLDI